MRLVLLLSLLLVSPFTGMASIDTHTVSSVDLPRYMGRWYVIANIPYFLEKGKVASYDTYELLPDGTMSNTFTFRRETLSAPEKTWNGKAEVINKTTNAEWKIRFIWPFSATYLVLELDPQYNWSLVGTPGGSLLWVIARTRQLPPGVYDDILARARARGYDTAKLVMVPQPQG